MIREYSFRIFSERKISQFLDAHYALQSCSARLSNVWRSPSTELAVYPEFILRRAAL